MKKIIYGLLLFLFSNTLVYASNDIYSISMNVYLDKEGNANITEVWDVKAEDGSEWYKSFANLGEMDLANFTVSMDGKALTKKSWNIDENLKQKKGYYGINTTNNGFELCFGKYDYKRHTFILEYTLTNVVFNTSDSQVVYNTFINRLSDVNFENFYIKISSYYSFPDTLDVWGYGYKGYAYVKDGVIEASNEGNMGSNYVVLLVRFPSDTFDTDLSYSDYSTFDEVLNKADEGKFDYDYSDNKFDIFDIFEMMIGFILNFGIPIIIFMLPFIIIKKNGYGYKDNKKIDKKNTPYFRDIPCNKDIYYADALIKLNKFDYRETNILGAIILKWVKEDKVKFSSKEKAFNKKENTIVLPSGSKFDNEYEQKLFDMMYKASKDGILENKELERWARNNYTKFFKLFEEINEHEIEELKDRGLIYKRKDKNECKKRNVMDDKLYEESVKLYGLKKFLEDFSKIDTKEVLEVKLWDEYLMFAYLFGIADKVAKQLKNLYPEVLTNNEYNIDLDTLIFINRISVNSVNAASSARSAAESYSSGGGGFSSGGGGGGSFGGGGGGGSR